MSYRFTQPLIQSPLIQPPLIRPLVALMWLLPSAICFAESTPSYAKDIQPILVDRCVSCHGPEKQKGDLRLDSIEAIRKGGKSGPVFVAGNPAKSTLYSSTILPKGDEDIMPAKGEPLTQKQTDAIRDWITAGAKLEGEVNKGPSVAVAVGPVHLPPSNIDEIAEKLSKPDASVIKALIDQGAIIVAISSDKKSALDVDLSHLTRAFNDSHVTLLERIAPNIFWLDLHETAVNDSTLGIVTKCSNLMRLHLDKTRVTSAGLSALKDSENLTYLNIIGTSVDDAGLTHLMKLTNLEKLYLTNSKVTQTGIAKLQQVLPKLKIIGAMKAELPPPSLSADEGKKKTKK
jgi:mono/diheme cytochrome c family protein